jgi:CheY-like chemotaxis protein
MSAVIIVRCPGCSARIKAPAQLAGRTRNCPGCGHTLNIPRPAPEDSEPLLTDDPVTAAPLKIAAAGALTAAPLKVAAAPAEEKVILLVDDDRELNDGLRSLLEKRGHRVIQAYDGLQARELIRRHRPDLMILDMMMPRLGGYPVLEGLHQKLDSPPVIMITAKEGDQHRVYAEYLGVVAYLNKPFPIDRFLESVEKGLSRRPA